MQNAEHIAQTQPTTLPRYTYPLCIKLFLLSLPILFFSVISSFIQHDFPKHKALYTRITQARNAFDSGDYYDAAICYKELLEEYPNFKEGRIELIKSCFVLSDRKKDDYFYELGLYYIGEENYELWEIFAMQEYAPECYKAHFEGRFNVC